MVAGLAAGLEASAIQRQNAVNGSGACQGALPNYEGNLRKRPTAIANEGSTNAFVSCSTQHDVLGNYAYFYGLVLNNNGTAHANVTCTLVAGVKINENTPPILIPKSTAVLPGGWEHMSWGESDNGGELLPPTGNWSCNLPPGTEIAYVYVYVEDGSAAPDL